MNRLLPLLGLAAACTGDQNLSQLYPEMVLPLSTLDFGEVVIGAMSTGRFTIRNDGRAPLEFSAVGLENMSADRFELGEYPDSIEAGGEGEVEVSYTPEELGPDWADLVLVTNEEEAGREVRVSVLGEGVEPDIDVDPETLWWENVGDGESQAMTVQIFSRGHGKLKVTDIALDPDATAGAAGVFSINLLGTELDWSLPSGEGDSFEVTFTPGTSTEEWDVDLLITSNDPHDPVVPVRLLANTDYKGEEPPTVEITNPDWGSYFLETDLVTFEGLIIDDADAPESLLGTWYVTLEDGTRLVMGGSAVEADGRTTYVHDLENFAGETTIELTATDSTDLTGSDSVDITVWEAKEPILFTISGGSTIFDYWAVDDDVTIYLDGVPIFSDTNHTSSTHPPVDFEAVTGQTIQIVASDINSCDLLLEPLTLHWGTAMSQPLNERQCNSSCSSHDCYSPDYNGPWPNTFYDQEFVIEIP